MNHEKKREILAFLASHPRGSTISEISEEIGVSRITASKYLKVLIAENKIHQREVGRAKLHYLEQENLENFSGAETT